MLIFPLTLVVGALLLDKRRLAGLTATVVAVVTLIMVAERTGLFVTRLSAYTSYRNLVDALIIIVITAVCLGLLAEDLRASLRRTRQHKATLESANAELARQAERLRASEERFRSLIELAVDAILLGDREGRITGGNQRTYELTGYSPGELLGSPVEILFPEEELRRAPLRYDLLESGQTVTSERRLRRKDGATVPVEMSSKMMPNGTYQSSLRDISERRQSEEQRALLERELQQSRKMEAVGRLAGGVAHDFNNLLFAISGCVELARRGVGPATSIHRWLSEAGRTVERAAGLTRQLLAFSRKQIVEPRIVDLRALVDDTHRMLARVIGEDVDLRILAPESLGLVRVDPGHVEQIVLNLAVNARDAMPTGGRLTIELADSELDARRDRGHADAKPGPCVTLAVSDTGHGIREEVRQQIFEPFFTTKPAGEGTGLGLAMVYGAVRQNGGMIEVDSAPDRGTTFRIHFPRAAGTAVPMPGATPTDERALPHGTETVLLVEDEDVVRDVAAEQLACLGYRVVPCESGEEALAAAERHEEPIDIVMTDVVMPGMDGCELARRLSRSQPRVHVLFCSAYPQDVVARHGAFGVETGRFIAKPYTLGALARKLREVLDA
jgi:PAS domain S-box-containing protein